MPSFSCSNCGTDGGLFGIVETDASGRTPCPVCRTPVMVLENSARRQAPKPYTLGMILGDTAAAAFAVFAFSAGVHALLWYVFSIDVVAWGGISLFGFSVPYFYLAAAGIVLAGFVADVRANNRIKAMSR